MQPTDLMPPAGAVILALGRADHAEGIRETTGGNYSHATLWAGDAVLEATIPAVRRAPLDTLNATSRYVDAYRHRALADRGGAVVRAGEAYVGRPYSRTDLFLASAITALSVWPSIPWLRYNVPYGSSRARQLFEYLRDLCIDRSRAAVTCVEMVALAHMDAGLPIEVRLDPSGRFDFRLLRASLVSLHRASQQAGRDGQESSGLPPFTAAEGGRDSLAAELDWAFEVQEAFPQDLEVGVAELQQRRWLVGEDWPAAFLTPKQLEESDSFETFGRLYPGGG